MLIPWKCNDKYLGFLFQAKTNKRVRRGAKGKAEGTCEGTRRVKVKIKGFDGGVRNKQVSQDAGKHEKVNQKKK